jgi:hypothetical protein
MFFDLSFQLQWFAREDTGGIRRMEDVLNSEEKQAGNIKGKGKKDGKDTKYDFIRNLLQLSACNNNDYS